MKESCFYVYVNDVLVILCCDCDNDLNGSLFDYWGEDFFEIYFLFLIEIVSDKLSFVFVYNIIWL